MKESVGNRNHRLTLLSVCELMLLIGIGGPALALLFAAQLLRTQRYFTEVS